MKTQWASYLTSLVILPTLLSSSARAQGDTTFGDRFQLDVALVTSQEGRAKSLQDRSRYWRCEAQKKWECDVANNCQPLDAAELWNILDFGKNTYQRCDRYGCDKYDMVVTVKGVFTYLTLPDHPDVFAKVGLLDMYIEVVSRGLSVYSSHGECKPVN